jgi:hypothetical protein
MASSDYLKIIDTLSKKRAKVSNESKYLIKKRYLDLYKYTQKELVGRKGYSRKFYKELQKNVLKELSNIDNYTNKLTIKKATEISTEIANLHGQYYNKLSNEFLAKKLFDGVPTLVMDNIISGKVYVDGLGLSERIWVNGKLIDNNMNKLITKALLSSTPVETLANDVLKYVNPNIKGSRFYYAQRLAKTTISHSYQLTLSQINKNNPFCEGLLWVAAGAKSCEICQDRDGTIYESNFTYGDYTTDPLPLEHPNGQCIIIPQMQDSSDISKQLEDWIYFGDDSVDKWTNGL